MGGGESKIIKGLDHKVNLKNDEMELNTCEFLTCAPEYFTNNNKIKSNKLLFIIILLILLLYFILIYNMKYI